MVMQQQMNQYQSVELEYGSGGSFEIPEEGKYNIKLLGCVKTTEFPNDDGGVDVSLTLQFVIDDPESDYDGVEFRSFYPRLVTPGNKSGKLFAALVGGDIKVLMGRGGEWEYDYENQVSRVPPFATFIGKRCGATLIHKESGDRTYAQIASVGPLKGKRERPAGKGVPSEPNF
jgi:hypothetical protein